MLYFIGHFTLFFTGSLRAVNERIALRLNIKSGQKISTGCFKRKEDRIQSIISIKPLSVPVVHPSEPLFVTVINYHMSRRSETVPHCSQS